MKLFLENSKILKYSSISLMILSFFYFLYCKHDCSDETNFLIEAVGVAWLAKEIPNIFLLILGAFNSNYLKQVNNPHYIIVLGGLIFLYYIYHILTTTFY